VYENKGVIPLKAQLCKSSFWLVC